jgi:23S rRNA pseudouridine955/2504/2580 synthase
MTQDKHSIGEMVNLSKANSGASVSMHTVDESSAGQRIDNYLTKILKGVPKSHLYRILRSGEVRVNSKRVDATYRVEDGDKIRIPPIRTAPATQTAAQGTKVQPRFENAVIFEDEAMLAVNKPAGMAVHGGSGISRGVIEQLRLERPQAKFLELVHRLDRETSGVLMIAKKRSALVALHDMMRANRMDKRYVMLVYGKWTEKKKRVTLSLQKHVTANGERKVTVEEEGQLSETIFHLKKNLGDFSLLEAQLITGRTHQLRVQLAHLGFPIAGDDKYGDFSLNKQLQKQGLKRMFLHSAQTTIKHPLSGESLVLSAPLPPELEKFLQQLESQAAHA